MKWWAFILLVLGYSLGVNAQQTINGEWRGAIEIQGQQLVVVFDIEGEPGSYKGTLDIPQQGAMGLNLTKVSQTGDSTLFAFFAGQGNGVFEGTFKSDSLISGTYKQGPAAFPFEVKKQPSTDEEVEEPGVGTELIIPIGEEEIGGTLVYPEGQEEAPLVIMISGSGAQNRDSNVFEFKIFAIISEHLKSQGIASFRYDDRQIGKSTGKFMDTTLDMLAEDVKVVVSYLTALEDKKLSEIILLGHSQGGVVAGKVTAENESIDQLILMASPGVALKEILAFQVKQGFGENVHSEEDVEKEIALREQLMKALKDEQGIEQARQAYQAYYKKMLENLSDSQKQGIPDLDAFASQQAQQLMAYYGAPQLKSLLFYDPAQDLEEIEVPVLVLFGGKDTQVTESQNRASIEKALKAADVNYSVEVLPEANHLFQKAETGQASEYALLEKEFVEGFLSMLSNWIEQN
jgi:pimeloyl-ACP methyl ester carboxylesterase